MLNTIHQLQCKVKEQEKYIEQLEKKIEKDCRSLSLDENLHDDLLHIMHEHHQAIVAAHPEDSFARISKQHLQ